MDREKVIKAWEIFRDSNPYEICDGREFRAIKEPEYCMGQMIEDTIALLKEQEAHLMTHEEMVEAGENEAPVFVEECPESSYHRNYWAIACGGIEPPDDRPYNYPGGVFFNVDKVDGDMLDGDFYMLNTPLGWRAWNKKPTEEQMKAVSWE